MARYRGDSAAAFSLVETGSGTSASILLVTVPLWQLSESTKTRTPGANFAHERVELVVDDLPVVRDPGLVRAILFPFTVAVGHLTAMTRVRAEEQIALDQLIGGLTDRRQHRVGRRLRRHQRPGLEAAALGDRLHVPGVELARGQRAVPTVVMSRVDSIEPDVQGNTPRHDHPPMS